MFQQVCIDTPGHRFPTIYRWSVSDELTPALFSTADNPVVVNVPSFPVPSSDHPSAPPPSTPSPSPSRFVTRSAGAASSAVADGQLGGRRAAACRPARGL